MAFKQGLTHFENLRGLGLAGPRCLNTRRMEGVLLPLGNLTAQNYPIRGGYWERILSIAKGFDLFLDVFQL